MKKVLSLVLATIVFATALVSCGVSKKVIVGEWKCVDYESGDYLNMIVKPIIYSMVFEFKEDGTVKVSGFGEFVGCGPIGDSEWKIKGSKVILNADGEESILEYKDNKLIYEKDGEKLVLEKNTTLLPSE